MSQGKKGRGIVTTLHQSKFFGSLFHTLNYCIAKELKDCETVLDLGCGPSSPIQFCPTVRRSVGVEFFKPYLEKSKAKKIHTEYVEKKIEDVDFPEKSFDAVVLLEVLEHLPEDVGYKILEKAERWAKKKIIISSPNGFIHQHAIDNNPLQEHLSGWSHRAMKKLGFRVRGLAGLKILRQESHSNTMGDDLLVSIRFKPKIFWFIIATLSQLFTYYFPSMAFELFSVRILETKD